MNTDIIRNRKKVIIGLIFLVIIGVPLTVFLALKQQETRSRASGGTVQFALSPQTATKNSNETFSADVNLNAGTYSLSGIDISIKIDNNIIDFVSFKPASSFDTVVINNYTPTSGVLRITAVNTENPPLTGTVKVGTLTLKAKAVGTGAVTIQSDAQVVASGQETPLPIDASINGSYTITETTPTDTPITDTPTATLTTNPTSTPTPSPTPGETPTPSEEPAPSNTYLNFSSIKLHGLGKGGDSINPNGLGDTSPLTPKRPLTVETYNSSGTLISTSFGNITYAPTTGDFSGTIKLPSTLTSGAYIIKVSSKTYLKKRSTGTITIIKDVTNQADQISLIAGDINEDQKLDLLDFNILKGCYSDLLPARDCTPTKKVAADISDDGNVDQDDFTLYQREMSVRGGD